MTMNQTGYLDHMSYGVKLQGMLNAVDKNTKTRSKEEELEAENKALKSQLEAAQKEIELLKTKIKLNNTLKQTEGTK